MILRKIKDKKETTIIIKKGIICGIIRYKNTNK